MFNLEINGIGQSGGGTFGDVSIEGIGRFTGPIKCQQFTVSGVGFSKEVECEQQLVIEGTLKSKSLKAKESHVSGVCKVVGEMKALTLNVFGYLHVDQSLKFEQAVIEGKAKLKESLEANHLELLFVEDSFFEVITATTIRMTRSLESTRLSQNKWFSLKKRTGLISGELIEGEDIHLEYAQVKQVYGDRVFVGPGCHIDTIEYKEQLEIAPGSVVKTIKQI